MLIYSYQKTNLVRLQRLPKLNKINNNMLFINLLGEAHLIYEAYFHLSKLAFFSKCLERNSTNKHFFTSLPCFIKQNITFKDAGNSTIGDYEL